MKVKYKVDLLFSSNETNLSGLTNVGYAHVATIALGLSGFDYMGIESICPNTCSPFVFSLKSVCQVWLE